MADLNFRLLGAVVVIAANAGGAWTPIGDVTTTMLWIHGQISTLPTMKVWLCFQLIDFLTSSHLKIKDLMMVGGLAWICIGFLKLS